MSSMASEFSRAVDDGLRLSKRLYFGKDADVILPPAPVPSMDKAFGGECCAFLPTSPMVYAVIHDPGVVDNPDLPSYQPHVYGKCDPPALIPLQMNGFDLAVDCFLDTVFVTLNGTWRVHCVKGSRSCDCRFAIPMGGQGSILGVEVDAPRKSYCTQLVGHETTRDAQNAIRVGNGAFLKPHIFTLTIPEIDGGSNMSIKVTWSQKLLYRNGQFSIKIPFAFPEYVTPVVKKIQKKEKIQVNVNVGTETEVLCKAVSHPLKEVRRHVGKLDFFYEANVLMWTKTDFSFSYTVTSNHMFGGVLLQSPSVHDVDQRDMFSAYIFPGNDKTRKVFKKDVVFVIDISGSMVGKLLEDTKNALYEALNKLDPGDSFNIIAFNGESYLFSTSMELATKEAVGLATQWISTNFIAEGGTNILPSLTKAVDMLSNRRGSLPIVILVTDGTVKDERHICKVMRSRLTNQDSLCPRLYTFGIGSYCNHYFLRMLAMIGRGHYDAAVDVDTVESRMRNLFTRASSVVLASITIDRLDNRDEVEVHPSCIPDLSSESPLIISGRYRGDFPETLKVKGLRSDFSEFEVDLKIQKSKEIPIDRVSVKERIDLLTAQAWYSEDHQLEEKVLKMSVQTGIPSEYTSMFMIEMIKRNKAMEQVRKGTNKSEAKAVEEEPRKIILVPNLCIGFGNLSATVENIPPGGKVVTLPEAAEVFAKAASNCCGKICGYCCCMCCIQCCGKINNQCALMLAQLCTALACLGCMQCCSDMCCDGNEG